MEWTVWLGGFFIFLLPAISLTLLSITGAVALALRAASKNERIGERVALLAFLLPVLYIGLGYGCAIVLEGAKPRCTFESWSTPLRSLADLDDTAVHSLHRTRVHFVQILET